MSANSNKARPPRRRDEARAIFRNAVLEAAEAVFAERGFHGARIQDIAERARIAVGTVYNHFEQKEDVLRALLEERTAELLERLSPRATDPSDFRARLILRTARILRFTDDHPVFFILATDHGLFGSSSPAAAETLGKKPIRNLERIKTTLPTLMKDGIRAGALEDADPKVLARIYGGGVRAFMLGAIQDKVKNMEDHAPFLVALFMNGVGTRATPSSTPRTPRKKPKKK